MNPEQWLSLKWNGGSTMSDRWLNQSKIIHYDLDEKSLKRKKKEKELEDYCIERICPICNFKKQTPCIVNKICNEEAVTDEEIEEAYKKMLEDKNKKCQEI